MKHHLVKKLILSGGVAGCLLSVCAARENTLPTPLFKVHTPGTQSQSPSPKFRLTKLKVIPNGGAVSAMTLHGSYTLQVLDAKTEQPVTKFGATPDALMRVVIVSKDLSLFNYLQPKYQGNGVFNFPIVLPLKGGYKLYADYTLTGGRQEVMPYDMGGSYIHLYGAATRITADQIDGKGRILKNVVAAPTGPIPSSKRLIATPQEQMRADAGPIFMNDGQHYRVTLVPTDLRAGRESKLHFQVRDTIGRPVALEPYLGDRGQCIALSTDTKCYLHARPVKETPQEHISGSDVVFSAKFPKPGLYKVWGQFLHTDKVITASFVLNLR